MVDELVHHTPIRRIHDKLHGRSTPVAPRRLMKKDNAGNVGKVQAQDIQNDSEYQAQVSIGTPGQTFNLDFDTSSADLWVWSTGLPKTVQREGKTAPNHHNIFDHTKSCTFKPCEGQTWNIGYGDGSTASGNVGTDTVEIGGVTVKNQAIEMASTMSSEFQQGASDGLLGLAWVRSRRH